jgi:hypothetical protein
VSVAGAALWLARLLGFEPDAEVLEHAPPHLAGDAPDVIGAGPGVSDDEVGVLAADLGLAEAKSLEAQLVDELGRRQLARRVLEVAAARGVVERVLAAPQLGVASDFVEQGVGLSGVQRERRLEDDGAGIAFETARAIAQCEVARCGEVLVAVGQHAGPHEGVAHGAAVGAGVADHGAAHRTRDVAGELESGEPALGDVEDDLGQQCAGAGREQLAVESRGVVARQHDEALDAAVGDEHVGRLAQHDDRQAELAADHDGVPQVFGAPRREQVLGRPADAIGAVRRDRHRVPQAGQFTLEDLADVGLGAVVHRPFPGRSVASLSRLCHSWPVTPRPAAAARAQTRPASTTPPLADG